MTHDEHVARAMLLGRRYYSNSRTYINENLTWDAAFRRLDADTLEPIDYDEYIMRLARIGALMEGNR